MTGRGGARENKFERTFKIFTAAQLRPREQLKADLAGGLSRLQDTANRIETAQRNQRTEHREHTRRASGRGKNSIK